MFRRQTVVKGKHIHGSARCQLGRQCSCIDTAPGGIATSMAVQNHIFLHMGPVNRYPFTIHILNFHLTDQNILSGTQKGPHLILRMAVLLNVRIIDHPVNLPDQCHHILVSRLRGWLF